MDQKELFDKMEKCGVVPGIFKAKKQAFFQQILAKFWQQICDKLNEKKDF